MVNEGSLKVEQARRVTELQIDNTSVSFGVFGSATGEFGGWHWADPFRPGAWHGPFRSLGDALQNAEQASRTWTGRGN